MEIINIAQAELYQPYRMNSYEYFIILELEHTDHESVATILRYNIKYSSGDHRKVGFRNKDTKLRQSRHINKMFLTLMFEIHEVVKGF